MEANSHENNSEKSSINWNVVSTLLTVLGLFFVGIGLQKNSEQISNTRQVIAANLMREFYGAVQEFNDVQFKLLENGEWRTDTFSGPTTDEEWFRLQRYMGFLEQIYYWSRDNIVELDRIDNGYSHRFKAIASHPVIRKKLLEEQSHRWVSFISIVCELRGGRVFKKISYSPSFDEKICQ